VGEAGGRGEEEELRFAFLPSSACMHARICTTKETTTRTT